MRLTGLLILALIWIGCGSEPEKVSTTNHAQVSSKVDFDRQLVDQHYNAVLWFARSVSHIRCCADKFILIFDVGLVGSVSLYLYSIKQ